ncbi:hypothetical protein Cfor_02314 [Coptotermes formosanus]|uniref:Large ribosomal subunit protein eL28 n=1 Tax=Coptotermes formosanus TaxID=36987 RepID=A0A6L2Q5C3_COPFO|nr:hypothetical protein Cfor_02314 [Coptotermes formosanus]
MPWNDEPYSEASTGHTSGYRSSSLCVSVCADLADLSRSYTGAAVSLPVAFFWLVGSFKMSAHLTWMIIRNNNAYLLKKRTIKKPFSTEPNNLTNLSSFRYSGLIHKKSVGVVAAPDNKGFTVVYKKSRASVS